MAWYPLFAHARPIPEIFGERVRLCTSYTWLLCGEITKLDIRLAVCLRGDGLPETQGMTRQGLRHNHRQFHRRCACSCKEAAESRSRWTSQIPWVATVTFDRIQLLCFQREIVLSNTTNSELEALSKSSLLLAMFAGQAQDGHASELQ